MTLSTRWPDTNGDAVAFFSRRQSVVLGLSIAAALSTSGAPLQLRTKQTPKTGRSRNHPLWIHTESWDNATTCMIWRPAGISVAAALRDGEHQPVAQGDQSLRPEVSELQLEKICPRALDKLLPS
jgi:hypothetical protein